MSQNLFFNEDDIYGEDYLEELESGGKKIKSSGEEEDEEIVLTNVPSNICASPNRIYTSQNSVQKLLSSQEMKKELAFDLPESTNKRNFIHVVRDDDEGEQWDLSHVMNYSTQKDASKSQKCENMEHIKQSHDKNYVDMDDNGEGNITGDIENCNDDIPELDDEKDDVNADDSMTTRSHAGEKEEIRVTQYFCSGNMISESDQISKQDEEIAEKNGMDDENNDDDDIDMEMDFNERGADASLTQTNTSFQPKPNLEELRELEKIDNSYTCDEDAMELDKKSQTKHSTPDYDVNASINEKETDLIHEQGSEELFAKNNTKIENAAVDVDSSGVGESEEKVDLTNQLVSSQNPSLTSSCEPKDLEVNKIKNDTLVEEIQTINESEKMLDNGCKNHQIQLQLADSQSSDYKVSQSFEEAIINVLEDFENNEKRQEVQERVGDKQDMVSKSQIDPSPAANDVPDDPFRKKVEEIYDYFGINIFQRGNRYREDGHIYKQNISEKENGDVVINSLCWGTPIEPYTQHIIIENGKIVKTTCTCPFQIDCKHSCASVLMYYHNKDSGKEFENPVSIGERLERAIKEVQDLKNILCDRNKEIEKLKGELKERESTIKELQSLGDSPNNPNSMMMGIDPSQSKNSQVYDSDTSSILEEIDRLLDETCHELKRGTKRKFDQEMIQAPKAKKAITNQIN